MADDDARARTLEIVNAYQTLMAQNRWDEWIALWAEDGVLEFPFAPAGRKSVYCGRSEILAYMKAAAGKIAIDGIARMAMHPLQDPHGVVVEVAIRGHAVASGNPYPQSYVLVFETEGGLLKHYREYWNPLVSRAAFGEGWATEFGSPA